MIALHATIHNRGISLLGNALLCNLWIYPIRETPHAWVNLTKLDRGAGVVHDCILEGRVELAVIEEDVWIVIPSVEMTLDRLDRLNDTVQLLISRQNDKRGIGSRFCGIRGITTCHKHLIVLLADFPAYIISQVVQTMKENESRTLSLAAHQLALIFLLPVTRDVSRTKPRSK